MLKRVVEVLRTGVEITADSSPFGLVEGCCDLRGMPFPENSLVKGCTFLSVDLSGASLRHAWIEASRFERTILDGADLTDVREHGNRFVECRFVGTTLTGAGIGHKGSRYEGCLFERAVFKRAGFIRPEFDGCEFRNCRLDGVDFFGSSFADCTFSGKVTDAWFRGGFPLPGNIWCFGEPRPNRMRNVTFRDATVRGLTFSDGCDLSTVVPPAEGDYRLYSNWGARVQYLREQAEAWPEPDRGEALIFAAAWDGKGQSWYLLSVDEIIEEQAAGARIVAALDAWTP